MDYNAKYKQRTQFTLLVGGNAGGQRLGTVSWLAYVLVRQHHPCFAEPPPDLIRGLVCPLCLNRAARGPTARTVETTEKLEESNPR